MTTDEPAITAFAEGLKQLGKRDFAAAAVKFNEGVSRAPQSFQGLRFRSAANHLMGKDDEALADLAECIRVNPTFEQPYAERAMILFKSGHYVQGGQAARAALACNPRDQFGRNFVVYGLRLEKKFSESLAELDLLFSSTWEYTHAELNRCRIWCELGKPERALEACQKVLDRRETAMQFSGVRGLFHFTRGYAYWVQNKTPQALDEYDEALRQHPDYAACLWFRAKAYTALGRAEEADVDQRRSLELDPLLSQNPLRW